MTLNNTSIRWLRISFYIVAFTIIFGLGVLTITVLQIPYSAVWQILLFLLLFIFFIVQFGSPNEDLLEEQESKIHASRELYATLYNQSPVPYVTLDERGAVTTANQAALRLLQTNSESLHGVMLMDRLTSDDENIESLTLGKLQANVSFFDVEFQIATFADEKRWVSVSLFVNETFKQRLVSLVDMTHRKQVDLAKSEFVALATHQLRTPIAAIRWNVELLERSMRDTATEKHKNYLEKINRNVARMLALINDFLSVSKLETGTFATSLESINITDYLETIIDEFQQVITEKEINFVRSFEPAGLQINTDSRLFHIISSNLLSNAVKYVTEKATIQFGYRVESNTMIITVADTGIGIPKEQLERLFSKFFRASNAQLHKAEGTGLGLYIVKESVEILGGTIDVQSIENQGTTFTVALPIN